MMIAIIISIIGIVILNSLSTPIIAIIVSVSKNHIKKKIMIITVISKIETIPGKILIKAIIIIMIIIAFISSMEIMKVDTTTTTILT